MPKIALLSDTHGHLDEAALKYFDGCDEIWHAGDFGTLAVADKLKALKPLRGVYGNIDGSALRAQFPENHLFEAGGLRVLMTHIAGAPGRYTPRVRHLLAAHRPGLLVCGHSHILKVQHDPAFSLMYMNPGAAGNEGFHRVKTLLLFTIENGALHRLEAVELGRRGQAAASAD